MSGQNLRVFLVLCYAGAWGLSHAAQATDLEDTKNTSDQLEPRSFFANWEFTIQPYFLPPAITGSAAVGILPETSIDFSHSDILNSLRFGVLFRLEALYRHRFGVATDLAYLNVGTVDEDVLPNAKVRFSAGQTIWESFAFYRILSEPRYTFDVLAGARYWDTNLSLDVSGTRFGDFSFGLDSRWVDPFVGLRGLYGLTDQIFVQGQADIGGFDVGSKIAWHLQGNLGYQINSDWQMMAGYKALSVDYNNHKSGSDRFIYDTITHGPMVSVAYRF
ncbi:hypothetical protein [Flexibacterium corallicola]|uniref:hypothetical protein n=1 Tax=Flexibacterium corallicola TaxID=3037259 RepID=UPI00286ED261|nr:hypothetical protein [Pseudovibrio sp. M1P-2-3]